MDQNAMIDLVFEDLDAANERLYVAALRYVRTFERQHIDMEHGHGERHVCRVNLGTAGAMLTEAADRYSAAYDRAAATGAFEEPEEDPA